PRRLFGPSQSRDFRGDSKHHQNRARRGINMPFLLLNEADSTSLSLRDANTLALLKQFEMPGRVAVLGISASGRYAFAVHRDDHMVTIIDSHSQTLIGSVTTGEQPTHFHAHDDLIVIFNDGSGSVSIFRESLIAQGDLTPQTVTVTQADHGSAVLIDGLVLAGH